MLIVGAKGFAKEVLEIVYRNNLSKIGGGNRVFLYDDITPNFPDMLYEIFEVLKTEDEVRALFKTENKHFTIGIGNPKLREKLYQKFKQLGGEFTQSISSNAEIGSFGVKIGEGCNILGGVRVSNDVTIGKGTMIYYNSVITHDVVIGDFVEISPRATLLGRCKIGDKTHIGAGGVIFPDVEIGSHCIIGAGAVVRENVPDGVMVAGVPAMIKKRL